MLEAKPSISLSVFIFIVNLALAYVFFIYGFKNPDGSGCFAREDNPKIAVPELDKTIELEQDSWVDVKGQFELWFKLGFVLCIFYVSYSIMVFFVYIMESENLKYTTNVMFYSTATISFLWQCLGIFYRGTNAGRVCSGDFESDTHVGRNRPYAWHSGLFIAIYLVATSLLNIFLFSCFFVSLILRQFCYAETKGK